MRAPWRTVSARGAMLASVGSPLDYLGLRLVSARKRAAAWRLV